MRSGSEEVNCLNDDFVSNVIPYYVMSGIIDVFWLVLTNDL